VPVLVFILYETQGIGIIVIAKHELEVGRIAY
jgi:hypothetical protein